MVRIESLLQTHTIRNILLIDKGMSKTDVNKYNVDLSALEMLFQKRHFDLIENFQAERLKDTEKFTDFETTFIKHTYELATTVLNNEKSQAELHIQIKNKINASYENVG